MNPFEGDRLTFATFNFRCAVYLNNDLILVEDYLSTGESGARLLVALGYEIHNLGKITDDHKLPKEFDKDEKGNWVPHKWLLGTLGQIKLYKMRLRDESIEWHREELARLEAEKHGGD